MSRSIASQKLALIKLSAVAFAAIIGVVSVLRLPTIYLYILLFAAGTGAFCMIGYQLLGMIREDDADVTAANTRAARQPAPLPATILSTDDRIVLDWARECLEAGNTLEAGTKLERISSASKKHPDVLKLRHQVCYHERRWHAALDAANTWTTTAPNDPNAWEAQAACLGEMHHFHQAVELLSPVAERFPKHAGIAYRLARLCAEMGRLESAQRWLFKALDAGDKQQLVRQAIADSALEPLLHFLGRRVLVEKIILSAADEAGRSIQSFAERHGIDHVNLCAPPEPGDLFKSRRPTATTATAAPLPLPSGCNAIVAFSITSETTGDASHALQQAQQLGLPHLTLQRDSADGDAVAALLTFLERHRVRCLRIAVTDATPEPPLAEFVNQTLEAGFDYQLRSFLHGTVTPATLRG